MIFAQLYRPESAHKARPRYHLQSYADTRSAYPYLVSVDGVRDQLVRRRIDTTRSGSTEMELTEAAYCR